MAGKETMTKARYNITISLTQEQLEKLEELKRKTKEFSNTDIFLVGIEALLISAK